MATLHLTIPDEPLALQTLARTLLEQAPEQGLPLVLEGRWIADPLWATWGDDLDARGRTASVSARSWLTMPMSCGSG